MTFNEITSLVGVLVVAGSCVAAIYNLVRNVENQVSEKFKRVWERFDEHKKQTDEKIDKCLTSVEQRYIRNDVYKVNYDSMKDLMQQQHNSLSSLIDERLKHINSVMEEIRKCPALRNGHNDGKNIS